MLALADGAIARLLIAATRLPADADRVQLLEDFARRAEGGQSGLSSAPSRAPGRRSRAARRSPAAAKQARYRARLKCGEATFPVPIGPDVVDFLVRAGWLPAGREVYSDLEVAEAAGACLRDTARCN